MSTTGFAALVVASGDVGNDEMFAARFADVVGIKPTLILRTESRALLVAAAKAVAIARSADGKVTLVVHGDLLPPGPCDAESLLNRYLDDGGIPATDLNGSFALLLSDSRTDEVIAVTDRLNSRKLYFSCLRGEQWLSSHLRLQPTRDKALDPIGVGWYLSHGALYAGRTLFEGIRSLARASVHEIHANGVRSHSFWDYQLEQSGDVNDVKLVDCLQQLLLEAVRRCIFDQPDVFLSLSGGYDAAAIVGILGECFSTSGVRCFSYARGQPQPGSDESIAAMMAKSLGYSHETIQSYDGKYLDWLRGNALKGGGVSNLCDELCAWETLAQQFAATSRPVILAGDECLGWVDCRLTNMADAFAAVAIWGFGTIEWLTPLLADRLVVQMREGVQSDIATIAESSPSFSDLHDLKDYLYVSQRVPNTITVWRQFFAGSFAPVRNPLLDKDILDFMRKVPARLRRQKRLYRSAVLGITPRVMAFPRAQRASYQIDHRVEVEANRFRLRDQLLGSTSRLDELLGPSVVEDLFRRCTSIPGCPSLRGRSIGFAKSAVSRLGLKDALRRFDRRNPCPPVPTPTLLARVLMLRSALSNDIHPFFTSP